jgi:hypothetical protein
MQLHTLYLYSQPNKPQSILIGDTSTAEVSKPLHFSGGGCMHETTLNREEQQVSS